MAERMTDAAVQARTGKTWSEWFEILDAAGARDMTHKQIVAFLSEHHAIGEWWQQTVAVGYEQVVGGRQKHQMPDGYQISVNKTLPVPLSRLYQAWTDDALRIRWLPAGSLRVRSGTPEKTLNARWEDGLSSVQVRFYGKGPDRSQVSVQHGKLPDAAAAERMKAFWGEALGRLAHQLAE